MRNFAAPSFKIDFDPSPLQRQQNPGESRLRMFPRKMDKFRLMVNTRNTVHHLSRDKLSNACSYFSGILYVTGWESKYAADITPRSVFEFHSLSLRGCRGRRLILMISLAVNAFVSSKVASGSRRRFRIEFGKRTLIGKHPCCEYRLNVIFPRLIYRDEQSCGRYECKRKS